MTIRIRLFSILIMSICVTSCNGSFYNLPFPEYGEYFIEEVTYYSETEEAYSNFSFSIVRQESTHVDQTYNIEFTNEYDKHAYFAKLSFDVNGIRTETNAIYAGRYEREPGNYYKFDLSFVIGDTRITNYGILLHAAYLGDASGTANTKFIHFAISSDDWTTGHMDIITIAEEEFDLNL